MDNLSLAGTDIVIENNYLVLEEISFKTEDDKGKILEWIENEILKNLKNEITANKIAIVSDERFRYFVKKIIQK